MNDLAAYQKLNNSYHKSLLFGVGLKAGFYSEVNNMILGMLYCLKNNIKFTLQSQNANFAYEDGWNDYFEPFCQELNKPIFIKHNYRMHIHVPKQSRITKLKIACAKKIMGVDYFTYQLFDNIRNRQNENLHYKIPQLGIDGNLLHACEKLIKLIYKYNTKTQNFIKEKTQEINLPQHYIGFHIRGGDKVLEQELISASQYFRRAETETSTRNAFVLTDDYSVILEIKEQFPNWNIFTFTEKDEIGYVHADFSKNNKNIIKDKISTLLASVELLSNAEKTYCTYGSNVGMFLKMRNCEKTVGLDYDNWKIL